MSLSAGEPEKVDDPGNAQASVEADHEAEEEGQGTLIEAVAANFQEEDFEGPGDEDGEGGVAHHLDTGNGIAQGSEGPPGEAVP